MNLDPRKEETSDLPACLSGDMALLALTGPMVGVQRLPHSVQRVSHSKPGVRARKGATTSHGMVYLSGSHLASV